MPDSRDENVSCLVKNGIAFDVARCTEADDDLTNIWIVSWHPECREVLQSLNRGPDKRQRASCGARVRMVEKAPESLDVLYGIARKGSSDLTRLRTRQFILGSPTRNPSLDVIQRYGESRPSKIVIAAAIFSDIGTGEVHH